MWRFRIHGALDGYSRLICLMTFSKNKLQTILVDFSLGSENTDYHPVRGIYITFRIF
jgi:hypothetical protein